MPPIAALKMLVALAVTATVPGRNKEWIPSSEKKMLSFVDIKRAHFCSAATREIYVEFPEESGQPQDKVARLLKSMYGCRDAAANWEPHCTDLCKE